MPTADSQCVVSFCGHPGLVSFQKVFGLRCRSLASFSNALKLLLALKSLPHVLEVFEMKNTTLR